MLILCVVIMGFSGVELSLKLGNKLIFLRIIVLTCWRIQLTGILFWGLYFALFSICVQQRCWAMIFICGLISCLCLVSGNSSLIVWICKGPSPFNSLSSFRRLVFCLVLQWRQLALYLYWKIILVALVSLLIVSLVEFPVLSCLCFSRLFVCKYSCIIPYFLSCYVLTAYNCH